MDEYNFDGTRELQSDEVEDAYEMLDFLKQYRDQEESVQFPLYETTEMDSESKTKWEELFEINLKEGAVFLAEPQLKSNHIPGVLDLFASLVHFKSGKKTE